MDDRCHKKDVYREATNADGARMISSLKPYPAYKDSGVPWLGQVPEHWRVQKLRSLLGNVAERNRPELQLLSVVREQC